MYFVRLLTGAVMALALFQVCCRRVGNGAGPAVALAHIEFHGWEGTALRNQKVEVVVVPAIGRVMAFRLLAGGPDESGNPFWSHPGIGPALAPDENAWTNRGGDKAWPAPQSAWPAIAGRGWPPPQTFDAVPYALTINGDGNGVQLVSPVDPAYGIRVRRTIGLDRAEPTMTIETTYEKVQGLPVLVAVWSITQLRAPERVFVLLPARSSFPGGYALRLPATPRALENDGRLLSIGRDPAQKTMIGSDGDALLWIGDGLDLLIENLTARSTAPGDVWPDGTHAQIYTSPGDAESYVELELLDRLRELAPGGSASMTVRYTLRKRVEADPRAEARAVFGIVGATGPVRGAEPPAGTGP